MNELQISYRPADEESAREFLEWRYKPPYDIYNCPPDQMEASIQYNVDPRNNVYAMFAQDEGLIGYCSYGRDAQVPGGDYREEALDIGLMIKPEMTGQGLGTVFAREVIQNGISRYDPGTMRVTIAAFNRRAIRTWEKNGFQQTQTFKRSRDGMEFVIMTKTISIDSP
jgi:[ribosomal protein S18]-alanine N-acetyltransferase